MRPAQRLTVTDGGRMSAARWCRALSVFLEVKVANFALLLSVRRTENRINVLILSCKRCVLSVEHIVATVYATVIVVSCRNCMFCNTVILDGCAESAPIFYCQWLYLPCTRAVHMWSQRYSPCADRICVPMACRQRVAWALACSCCCC